MKKEKRQEVLSGSTRYVQPKTTFMKNCSYNLASLANHFWLVDADKIQISNYTASLQDAEKHHCLRIEFESEGSLEGRYRFGKQINITLQGYQPDLVLDEKRVAVETKEGELYLVNVEFGHLPTYVYTLNSKSDQTVYNLELPENLPIFPVLDYSETEGSSSEDCSYTVSGSKTLELVPRNKCFYSSSSIELLGATEPITFENLRNLVFREEFDGYRYEQTCEFTLPLNPVDEEVSYRLQEFQDNRYLCVVRPNGVIAGIDLGLGVSTTIRSSDEESTITVVLASDENFNLHQNQNIVFTRNSQIVWKYINKTPDGQYGYVCRGEQVNPDGEALHILQAGYYKNGQPNGEYRVHINYRNGWFHGLNIVGVFTQNVYFQKDSCYAPDTLTVDGIVSPHTFVIVGQQRPIDITSRFSDWTATTVPSFCTLSVTSGSSGKTRTVLTCTGNTSEQGTLLIANDAQAQSFTIIADFSDPVIIPSSEIDYKAQVKNYFIRKPVYLVSKSSTSGFDASVAITGKTVRIVFAENGTSGDVVHTFVFATTSYPHVNQTVVITQHPQ